MSTIEAAALLGCSRMNVNNLIARGELKAYRLSDPGWWRVDSISVKKFLAARIRMNGSSRATPAPKRRVKS